MGFFPCPLKGGENGGEDEFFIAWRRGEQAQRCSESYPKPIILHFRGNEE
jgi:hypothetical protein